MSRLALAYGATLLGLSAIHLLAPQRDGPLAISQVFAPHLFLPLIVVLPLVLARGTTAARAIVIGAAVVGAARFVPGMVSFPPAAEPGRQQLQVLSWNLAAGRAAGDLLVERLLASRADVVGLQEVRHDHVAAIDAEPRLRERFPYRVVQPHDGVLGMTLLSAHPIRETTSSRSPPMIVSTVEVPTGARVTVATAHPLPARIRFLAGVVPVGYDAAARDSALMAVRGAVLDGSDRPIVLIGDFNVTDREPAYRELTADLIDAHAAVGVGSGSTWRPPTVDFLPFGILRIDYVFTAGGTRPLSLSVECLPDAGDHCLVTGAVELP